MRQFALFDSHCDTAYEIWRRRESIERTSCCVDLPQMQQYESCGQFFAFCTYPGVDLSYSCEELLWSPYRYFMDQLDRHERYISLCKCIGDYESAVSNGKIAAFLSLEGAEGIGCDPGRLEELHDAGFSMVNLTWNEDNALAGCAARDGGGLTAMGREFVKRAQEIGMIIDVSHISDRAFWDIMDLTQKPVVASHSNSRAICDHCRNLTDEQFKAICLSGGYVGINLYSAFLTKSGYATFEDVYRHIMHFLSLVGEGHIALGGDLDGCDTLPTGFSGLKDYRTLASYLESNGFSEQMMRNIYCNTIKEVVKLCIM